MRTTLPHPAFTLGRAQGSSHEWLKPLLEASNPNPFALPPHSQHYLARQSPELAQGSGEVALGFV